MLTADLLVTTIRKGRITPRWFVPNADELERVEEIIGAFVDAVGESRDDLDEAVDMLVGNGTDFQLWRGLAKLLHDRTTLEVAARIEPVVLRRAVFEAAAGHVPTTEVERRQTLAPVLESLGVTQDEFEAGFFADLPGRQRLATFERITASELVDAYNLALAQAVLYRATALCVRFKERRGKRLNAWFRALKFHGLMHRVRYDSGEWTVDIDGPASILSQSRKYGLQMAMFLPWIVSIGEDAKGEAWAMSATIQWERHREVVFELNSASGLRAHRRPKGQWISDEEKMFETRFAQKVQDWGLERDGRVFTLSNGSVITTDYVMRRADGREVFVDVVGFWRADYLRRRLDLLQDLKEPVVLVVAERLRSDSEPEDEPQATQIVYYKGVIRVELVCEAANAALEVTSQG